MQQTHIHKPTSPACFQDVQETARVTISGYFYAVDFGPGEHPQHHRVGKDRNCTCRLGGGCPAVTAVADYLRAGGERTPDPPAGYYPVAPTECPICGAETVFDNHLSSKHRGAGWRCRRGGAHHYWQTHINVLRQRLEENPWLFPPVVVRDGKQIKAYDGILPQDQVLYSGVKRAEIA